MTERLGRRIWTVWKTSKTDEEWAAEIDGLLKGKSVAEKVEAQRLIVRSVVVSTDRRSADVREMRMRAGGTWKGVRFGVVGGVLLRP
jgi:hypothetical protein